MRSLAALKYDITDITEIKRSCGASALVRQGRNLQRRLVVSVYGQSPKMNSKSRRPVKLGLYLLLYFTVVQALASSGS
jgi:hypothetical protein